MKKMWKKGAGYVATLLAIVLILSVTAIVSFATSPEITVSGGWFESAYAEWTPVSGADGYNAYVASAGSNGWTKIDSELVRDYGSSFRVDAVGLKAGEYQIKIVPTSDGSELTDKALLTDTLVVSPYDRSGYAHFNYTEGVGAYNDDGTLKDNAIVLYVTNENKNTVSVTSKDGTTVTGIGNILGSTGMDVGGGVNAKGGIANTNQDIIRKLANDGTPLVIRIIGDVKGSDINGLTAYDSIDYGGSVGDNGYMARMSGGKDITIEGIGYDATINGWGLHFICQTADYSNGIGKSFEVRNIAFKNVPEDCVGMEGQQEDSTLTAPVERCWIHNCTFYAPVISNPAESDKDGGDGACDFKRGQYFTNSYCYYNGYHKTNLVGSSDSSLQYHLTYHHNYWKQCESRGPLARQANIHMYNNIFEGQTSYCMNPRANAYIFSEYNMFLKCKNPVQVRSGAVKSYNDSFASCIEDNDATIVTDRATQVSSGNKYENFDTNSTLSYIPTGDYIIQESISDMRAVVIAYAGNQKQVVKSPSEVNTSVIPIDRYPTAAVVLDYSKTLDKNYITSTGGTYDNIVFNVKKVASDCITVGGTPNDCDIVFYVDTEVNISMTAVAGTYLPVLCNANGEEIITGTGSANNLPSGYYFIQSGGYDVGGGKYKESKLSALSIYAIDPNAAPNPITPPPAVDPDQGGAGGDNGNTGDDSGNTGGDSGNQGGNVTVPVGSYTHNITENGTTDPNGFFTLVGSTSTSKGDVVFDGKTLTKCLKVGSSSSIKLTAPADGKVTLVFNPSCAGYTLSINGGDALPIPSNGLFEFDVKANTSYEVLKVKSESFLYYLVYTPNDLGGEGGHTHSYVDEETKEATCTEAGLITYTCECGESYTETVKAKGHDFVDGFCVDCGVDEENAPEPDPEIPEVKPEGPTSGTHIFQASDVELGADKDPIAAGFTYVNGLFKIEGSVTKRVDEGAEFVKSIELKKDLGGAVIFSIGADAKVSIVVSSTGGSNTSAFAIVDANGNVVANLEGVDTVYGSMESRITVNYELKAGTYKVVCPNHAEYDRGVRLYEIKVVIGEEEIPHEHVFVEGKCECGAEDPDYVKPDEPGVDTPVDPDNGEKPGDETPDTNPETPDKDEKPDEEPKKENFFVRIWMAIVNFFKKLFGIKD